MQHEQNKIHTGCRKDKRKPTGLLWYSRATYHLIMARKKKGQKKKKYESSSHTLAQNEPIKQFQNLITKILFCISLKYLKMYSIVVFFPFVFCKVMLQHVFNNHNNINMNDIQNSNNYSRIITLPRRRFGHTSPYVWPCEAAA